MFKIGEFSKLTQVSIRMLRYYDETNLLKPDQIDAYTGYRKYTINQIETLQKICLLRDLGFSTSEIAETLENWYTEHFFRQIEKKKKGIEQEIQQEQQKLKILGALGTMLTEEKRAQQYNFKIKSIPAYSVISIREILPTYFDEATLWHKLGEYVKEHNIKASAKTQTLTIFHDIEHKDRDVDVEVCMIIEEATNIQQDVIIKKIAVETHMASTLVYGPFENIDKAYLDFATWLSAHNQYEMKEPTRQICHRGPWNEVNSEKYITEIQIPLKVKR